MECESECGKLDDRGSSRDKKIAVMTYLLVIKIGGTISNFRIRYNPHDRKRGGLVVLRNCSSPGVSTMIPCKFRVVFPHPLPTNGIAI